MILPIAHVESWRYISQSKQEQIDKYVICNNSTRINQDYRVEYKFLIRTKSVYKYKKPFPGPCEVVQTWKNGTVTLRVCAVTYRINIHRIKPYTTDNSE